MKRTEPLLFSEIFNRVVEQSGHADTYAEQRACFVWPEVVGQGVNRYTSRRYVSRGLLHVYIDSAPLKTELEFRKSAIVEAINSALGTDMLKGIIIH